MSHRKTNEQLRRQFQQRAATTLGQQQGLPEEPEPSTRKVYGKPALTPWQDGLATLLMVAICWYFFGWIGLILALGGFPYLFSTSRHSLVRQRDRWK